MIERVENYQQTEKEVCKFRNRDKTDNGFVKPLSVVMVHKIG